MWNQLTWLCKVYIIPHPFNIHLDQSWLAGYHISKPPIWCLFLYSELPHLPRSLTARLNDSDSRSVLLSWLRPFDGNSPLLHYVLELSENSMYMCVCFCVCVSGWIYVPWVANICSLAVDQPLTHSHLQEADIWRIVLLRKCTSSSP